MTGRFALSGRPRLEHAAAPVFACRLSSITPFQAVLISAEPVEAGELVAAHFEAFGLLKAKAVRKSPTGFVIDIIMDDQERKKLAAKIDWQKRKAISDVPDRREHKRILPRNPRATLMRPDGGVLPCFVIDISSSGAAISTSVLPPKGTALSLGSLVGRVIRRLDVGFAIQFVELQQLDAVEGLAALPGDLAALQRELRTPVGQSNP